MKKKHQMTLKQIFARPVSGSIRWADIEALFVELGAEVSERAGSRIAPAPTTDKGAVASVRIWLESHGVKP